MAAAADTHQFGNITLSGKDAHREESIGALRMHAQGFGWKSRKTGKVIAISKGDIRAIEWMKVPHAYMIRIRAKGSLTYRFSGLRSQDKDAIKEYCTTNFGIEPRDVQLSWRGWNWGEASVEGMHLSFSVEDQQAFEIPLNDVTQATSVKNEAVIEMADDDTALPEDEMVVELRFHVPTAVDEGEEAAVVTGAEALVSSIQESGGMQGTDAGTALAAFDDVPIQVPRGRYEIEMFDKYMKLHGKTYDYKVLYTNVSGIFVLPKPDNYHMALCVTLEHPLRQGATMYPHLIMQLPREEQIELTLNMPEDEVSRRFNGKLEQEEQGSMTEVIAKVLSGFTKKKVTTPKVGGFNSDKEDKFKSIRCSMKAVDGQLYPLDKCFFFVATKPVMLEFDRVASIEFNRVDKATSASAARTFDVTLYMKDGSGTHQFVNLQRSDYNELFRFLTSKQIRIKNINTAAQADFDDEDDDGDADDPYLDRVKRKRSQAAVDEDDDEDDEDEGEDEDFAPGEDSDVDEEYEEGPEKAGEGAAQSDGDDDDSDADVEEAKPKPKAPVKPSKPPKPVVEKKAKPAKEPKPDGKKKRQKKDKDAPKRGQSAYFLWLNANRSRIKQENPDAAVTQIAKIGGAQWKEVNAAARAPWEEMAAKDKARYEREMKEYKAAKSAAAAAVDDDDDDDGDADAEGADESEDD